MLHRLEQTKSQFPSQSQMKKEQAARQKLLSRISHYDMKWNPEDPSNSKLKAKKESMPKFKKQDSSKKAEEVYLCVKQKLIKAEPLE